MTDVPRLPEFVPGGLARVRLTARRWVDSALDLVFPPRCVHCKRMGSLLCPRCLSSITPLPEVNETAGLLAGRRATGIHDGALKSAVLAFKYKHMPRLADVLAARLVDELRRANWNATVITAVPLHADRLHERGYNQSQLLALRLAESVGLPFNGDLIRRIRNTRPQVGLNQSERLENVAGAFEADPAAAAGQSVVVIDDVYTTGATLSACADALKRAGAAKIWALTLASAHHRDL
jgi:ComF family protein